MQTSVSKVEQLFLEEFCLWEAAQAEYSKSVGSDVSGGLTRSRSDRKCVINMTVVWAGGTFKKSFKIMCKKNSWNNLFCNEKSTWKLVLVFILPIKNTFNCRENVNSPTLKNKSQDHYLKSGLQVKKNIIFFSCVDVMINSITSTQLKKNYVRLFLNILM